MGLKPWYWCPVYIKTRENIRACNIDEIMRRGRV